MRVLLLWRQARKAGYTDGASKETEEAEELLLLNKPFAQFISPLTHLVSVSCLMALLMFLHPSDINYLSCNLPQVLPI